MNFNHLAVFETVARLGNVSRAAESLSISQPAASKQIKLLEASLQTTLIDRLPRGVRLTAAGEVLAAYARRVFALADEAEQAVSELAGLRRGRLRVAATPTIGLYYLPKKLVQFRRLYPGIEMQLEIHPTAMIAKLLGEGAIDFGLAESEVMDERLRTRAFMTDRLVAIASASHPLAKKRSIKLTRLVDEPFVVREVGSGSKSLVERSLARRGLTIMAAMSLGSTEAIKRAVIEGVGVAVVSQMAIEAEVRSGSLAE